MAVEVEDEKALPVAVGPVVAQVDHGTDVGVTSAGRAVLLVALALTRVGPPAAGPVDVIGTALEQAVEITVEVLAVHALEVRAGDDVEEVRDHAVGDESLPVIVEIETPGVGGTVRDGLENLAGGMIAPDAAVDRHALGVGSSRLADA